MPHADLSCDGIRDNGPRFAAQQMFPSLLSDAPAKGSVVRYDANQQANKNFAEKALRITFAGIRMLIPAAGIVVLQMGELLFRPLSQAKTMGLFPPLYADIPR